MRRLPRLSRFARLFASPLLTASAVLVSATGHGEGPVPPESAATSLQRLKLPPVTSVRLDNGMTLVMEENHDAPFVSMWLRYAAGSDDDEPGKAGEAELTLRMMTLGTDHAPAGTYDETLLRIGATDWTWDVGRDTSWLKATVPRDAVADVLWLWSDQMGFFDPRGTETLDDAQMASKRRRAEVIDNAAYGAVRGLALHALDPRSTLERGTIALDDVRRFKDAWLVPNHAVLAVSGDFRPAEMARQVEKWFAPITPGTPTHEPEAPPRLDKEIRLEIAAGVHASMVGMHWTTPALYDAGDAELDIVAQLLAGSTPALHWRLVDQLKVATRVSARQASRRRGSDFEITAVVADGHSPNEVIAAIDKVLAELRQGTVKDEYFAKARDQILIPRLNDLDRPMRRAALEAQYSELRHDPAFLPSDLGRYEAMTPADVRGAMVRWLDPSSRVVAVVTVDRNAPPCGVLRGTRGAQ